MTYLLIALCFALLAFIYLDRQDLLGFIEDERRKAREERAMLFGYLKEQGESFRAELASLHQARMEEVANLTQRIQAPKEAVASHQAHQAGPDPLPVRLENDEDMFEAYQERIDNLGALSG